MKVWDPVKRELIDVIEYRSELFDISTTGTDLITLDGKTFFLRTVNAINSNTVDVTVTISDGTVDLLSIVVPASGEKTITEIRGYYFKDKVTARASTTGVKMSVGGLREI